MSFDSLQLRTALGRFATGVCIITAHSRTGEAFGLTANSFSSLSLMPPLVLWSLQKASDTMDDFAAATQYCVNVLSQEQRALSIRFAQKGEHALEASMFSLGKSGLPVLHGALASFECAVDARHDGGDHVIIVGRVIELCARAGGRALVFYEGGYRELR
jgi:flavin reductase (DIM6/NTAB) family NADH-FMN oxidoreductase RutF